MNIIFTGEKRSW